METLPEAFSELLAWIDERDRERQLRNLAALQATGTRAPPPPPPARSPQKRGNNFPINAPVPTPARSSPGWRYITAPEDLPEALEALAAAPFLAIDTETSGLDPLRDALRLLQLAGPGTLAYLIDLPAIPEADRSGLREILAGPLPKVLHNGKFDMAFLARAGLPLGGPVFDTMLAAQVLGAGLDRETSLAATVRTYLKRTLSKELQASDWSAPTLSPEQLEYAAEDALVLVDLRPVLAERLKAAGLVEAARLEFACLPAVVAMEASGISIDLERWERLTARLEEDLKEAEQQARAQLHDPGLNLNSPGQVQKALRGLGLEVSSTKKEVLAGLAEKSPAAAALLRYREVSKLLTAFGRRYPQHVHPLTGRIHARYRQLGAATGRMACADPNLQQVPHDPEIRSCFIAPPGARWVIADYSQIELRVMAQLSQDKRMLEAYRNGEDLHRLTASLVTGAPLEEVTKEQRQAAKAVNFGLIYAMGAKGLRDYAKNQYGVALSMNDAKAFREAFFGAYPGVAAWHDRMRSQREARTLSGRLRRWPEGRPPITEVFNAPVQGTAADILKLALANLLPRLEPIGGRLVAVVHDEVIAEVPEGQAGEAARIVQETLEEAGAHYLPDLPVTVEATIARNWSEK